MMLGKDAVPILIATGRAAHAGLESPSLPSHVPLIAMGRVLLLVGMAIVVFMASTAYSVHKQVRGSSELLAIRDTYFPVLQRLDANLVRVDKIPELYVQVVGTGDRELLTRASEICAAADKTFKEINALYPGREADIERLRSDLKQYAELATKVSLALLNSPDTDISVMSAGMSSALSDLKTRLTAQRQSTYDGFVQTLAGSQRDAGIILYMGLALGLMNLGFMAVLVYFIRNNVKMMSVIAEQNATLELRVAERTAQLSLKTNDINAMLQNMKLGVATIVPGNRIHHEYSSYLRVIFGMEEFAGKELTETLLTKSDLGVDVKDQIAAALGAILGEDAMVFDFNNHLLAREIRLNQNDGTSKIVQMDWSPIVNEHGSVDKVLLISQDVTHLRELELSTAQQKEEMKMISRLMRITSGKFNAFIESAGEFIRENHRFIDAAVGREPQVIAALFRNMHTLKGNARAFEFTHISDAAHRAEQTYDDLRKNDSTEWHAAILHAELRAVEQALAQYVRVHDDKLGRKRSESELLTPRGVFIDNEQLLRLRSLAAASEPTSADVEALRESIDRLGSVCLERLVSGSVDALSSLAAELHRPTPTVEIVGGDCRFNAPFAETLKSCLMHILRNALDHGIECPEDRTRVGKLARGTVRFECKPNHENLQLCISDDGRGLALQRLYEIGVAAGLFGPQDRPTREEIANLIFRSGLSTASAVSQMSGRGVGMDAVMTFLQEQGASIRIVLLSAGETLDFASFKFVIDVPSAALRSVP